MQIQNRSRLVTIILVLMIAIVCLAQSWGIERIGQVEETKGEDAKVKERTSAEQEWLHRPKEKNILSDDTIYTRKANATIRLDDDGSTWELFQHAIVRFTKEPSQCPAQKKRRKHVVVTQDKGRMTVTYVRRGERGQVASETHTTNAVICVAGTTFHTLFSPQSNTTVVTSFEETVMVRNPQHHGDSPWVEVQPNEQALVVGNMPPIKPKERQNSDVLLSAVIRLWLPYPPKPPIVLPGVPVHGIDGERRDPRKGDPIVDVIVIFPEG